MERFTSETDGERVDRYMAAVGAWSRASVQRLIAEGCVTVDGRAVRPSARLRVGQVICVTVPAPASIDVAPEDIPLDIRFEDDDLIVVNKPRGMVVHPSPGHARGTLVGALLGHIGGLSSIGGALRPGIVHRIDKDTSGLLVVAKTDLAHLSLSEQLREHTVTRVYEAIVHGNIGPDRGQIDAPIGRDPHKRQQMAVVPQGSGRAAVTHFQVLERLPDFSYVELRLETGRTHQIRVHMSYIGHPVAGDPLYATRDPLRLGGQALHARTLGFTHPRTLAQLTFHSDPPDVFIHALAELRRLAQSI
ncbi:MAG: RluA family pseudouridine synthase [Acidimicrobiales bacterium]